jgi:hypothetical protein
VTCALDRSHQLALVPCARPGYPLGNDLPLLADKAVQFFLVLIVDIYFLVVAEPAGSLLSHCCFFRGSSPCAGSLAVTMLSSIHGKFCVLLSRGTKCFRGTRHHLSLPVGFSSSKSGSFSGTAGGGAAETSAAGEGGGEMRDLIAFLSTWIVR